MTAKNDRIVLKRLLDLSDELGRIRFGQREVMLKHGERKELASRAREKAGWRDCRRASSQGPRV